MRILVSCASSMEGSIRKHAVFATEDARLASLDRGASLGSSVVVVGFEVVVDFVVDLVVDVVVNLVVDLVVEEVLIVVAGLVVVGGLAVVGGLVVVGGCLAVVADFVVEGFVVVKDFVVVRGGLAKAATVIVLLTSGTRLTLAPGQMVVVAVAVSVSVSVSNTGSGGLQRVSSCIALESRHSGGLREVYLGGSKSVTHDDCTRRSVDWFACCDR